MNASSLSILNISLDRGLVDPSCQNETQVRQCFYCQNIPAHIVHLVKAPMKTAPAPLVFGNLMSAVPCRVLHWSFFLPRALYQGWLLLKANKFDLIQVQEPYFAGLIGLILSKLSGVPLVVGLFSDEVDNPLWLKERALNRIANAVAKFVLKYARAARSDSMAVAKRVNMRGYCPTTFIPFLITHADALMIPTPLAAKVRAEILGGKKGPLLLAVNRLEPEKNIPLLLRSVAALHATRQGVVLAIAGTGALKDSLEQEAEKLMPGCVRWLGWIPADQMGSYYQAADLLVISSNRESAARVLTESLLCSTPVLSTDTAGAREVIEDGISGVITPVADLAAFTHALLNLTSNEEQLKQMGKAGLETIKDKVTKEAVARALQTFYKKALGTNR